MPHLPVSHQQTLLNEVVALARQATLDWQKSEMLEGVITHLPAELLGRVGEITNTIQDQEFRIALLVKLAPCLAEAKRPLEALAVARSITDNWRRAKTLAHLAPLLEKELQKVAAEEAHQAALAMTNPVEQAAALAGLVPQLAQMGYVTEALTIIEEIWYEKWRVKALASVAPHLSRPQLSQALIITHAILDKESQMEALGGLAPHLPQPLLTQALKEAQSIQDQQKRAATLLKLAPCLPEPMKQTALQGLLTAIQLSCSKSEQLDIFGPILAHLLPAQRQKMTFALLQLAGEADETSKLVAVIVRIAEYLPKDHLPAALRLVETIQGDDGGKVEALLSLLPQLPPDLLPEMVRIAVSIQDSAARVEAVKGLAPFLPDELHVSLLPQPRLSRMSCFGAGPGRTAPLSAGEVAFPAMQIIQGIEDEWRRAEALRLLPFG